jgi:hypothetical protein
MLALVSSRRWRLHVVSSRHDVEAAVSPSVPDRREEHVAVGAVGRKDGNEGTLEQPVEFVGAEALSHTPESNHTCMRRVLLHPREDRQEHVPKIIA